MRTRIPPTRTSPSSRARSRWAWATSFEATKRKAYPPGSFLPTPAKTNRFASAKAETIVQISSMGLFAINYVDAKDDPRKSSTSK